MHTPGEPAQAGARTITVSVTFFADLRRFLRRGADGPQPYTLAEGATVADLLAALGIPRDAEVTAAVGGELAGIETSLCDGMEVMLLSPMEGGSGSPRRTAPRAGAGGGP